MNKYYKAWSKICDYLYEEELDIEEFHSKGGSGELISELVEKATPKDVEKTEVNELGYTHECPSCGSYVGTICDGIVHEDKYCCLCGQRLWWGEE